MIATLTFSDYSVAQTAIQNLYDVVATGVRPTLVPVMLMLSVMSVQIPFPCTRGPVG